MGVIYPRVASGGEEERVDYRTQVEKERDKKKLEREKKIAVASFFGKGPRGKTREGGLLREMSRQSHAGVKSQSRAGGEKKRVF